MTKIDFESELVLFLRISQYYITGFTLHFVNENEFGLLAIDIGDLCFWPKYLKLFTTPMTS